MALSLKMALKLKEYVSDLKAIIFRNRTDIDFIISDNPLVLTNRFSFQRLKESAFGLSNSGAILAMPMTPKMCLVWYDRGVYNVPNASGTPFVDVKRGEDAASINEWQYLHAQENLYFFRWEDRPYIQEQAERFVVGRQELKPVTALYVRDYSVPGESYRRGTAAEEAAAKKSLILARPGHPEPSRWPSLIKFRTKPKTYSNGSAIGFVRSAEWLKRRRRG